jgi:hypothetical protein
MKNNINNFFAHYSNNDDEISKLKSIRQNERIIKFYSNFYTNLLAELLYLMPLDEKDEKMFFNLPNTSKKGFLSRYIMKCAKKVDIPDVYINKYLQSKKSLKIFIKMKNKNIEIYNKILNKKKDLKNETIIIIKAILQTINNKSVRQKKIEDIFLND